MAENSIRHLFTNFSGRIFDEDRRYVLPAPVRVETGPIGYWDPHDGDARPGRRTC